MGCVYVIQNLANGKNYVGQTIKPSCRHRYESFSRPRLDRGNRPIDRAFKKYGASSFSFVDLMKNVPESDLDAWERFWIKAFDCCNDDHGYNLESGGNKKKRRHPESNRKASASMKGRILCPKGLAKIIAYSKDRKGKPGMKWTKEMYEKHQPSKHPAYKMRRWAHPVFGRFDGGLWELVKKFPAQNLSAANLCTIANGGYGRKTEKGWRLFHEDNQLKLI